MSSLEEPSKDHILSVLEINKAAVKRLLARFIVPQIICANHFLSYLFHCPRKHIGYYKRTTAINKIDMRSLIIRHILIQAFAHVCLCLSVFVLFLRMHVLSGCFFGQMHFFACGYVFLYADTFFLWACVFLKHIVYKFFCKPNISCALRLRIPLWTISVQFIFLVLSFPFNIQFILILKISNVMT